MSVGGERAFPVENPRATEQRGMTLRDYCATQALPTCLNLCVAIETKGGTLVGAHADVAAKAAYEVADAMMRARVA